MRLAHGSPDQLILILPELSEFFEFFVDFGQAFPIRAFRDSGGRKRRGQRLSRIWRYFVARFSEDDIESGIGRNRDHDLFIENELLQLPISCSAYIGCNAISN